MDLTKLSNEELVFEHGDAIDHKKKEALASELLRRLTPTGGDSLVKTAQEIISDLIECVEVLLGSVNSEAELFPEDFGAAISQATAFVEDPAANFPPETSKRDKGFEMCILRAKAQHQAYREWYDGIAEERIFKALTATTPTPGVLVFELVKTARWGCYYRLKVSCDGNEVRGSGEGCRKFAADLGYPPERVVFEGGE